MRLMCDRRWAVLACWLTLSAASPIATPEALSSSSPVRHLGDGRPMCQVDQPFKDSRSFHAYCGEDVSALPSQRISSTTPNGITQTTTLSKPVISIQTVTSCPSRTTNTSISATTIGTTITKIVTYVNSTSTTTVCNNHPTPVTATATGGNSSSVEGAAQPTKRREEAAVCSDEAKCVVLQARQPTIHTRNLVHNIRALAHRFSRVLHNVFQPHKRVDVETGKPIHESQSRHIDKGSIEPRSFGKKFDKLIWDFFGDPHPLPWQPWPKAYDRWHTTTTPAVPTPTAGRPKLARHVEPVPAGIRMNEECEERSPALAKRCADGVCETGVYCVDYHHVSEAPSSWNWGSTRLPCDEVCIDDVVYQKSYVDQNCRCAGGA